MIGRGAHEWAQGEHSHVFACEPGALLRHRPSMIRRGIDWWLSVWGLGLRPQSWSAWVFALGCVAIATLVREGLGLVSPDSAVFAPYYSATLVAALVAGAAAGSVAAIAGGLVALWLFVPPDWVLAPFVKEQVVSVLMFAISSIVIVSAAEG